LGVGAGHGDSVVIARMAESCNKTGHYYRFCDKASTTTPL
jgi:hypothetical protein